MAKRKEFMEVGQALEIVLELAKKEHARYPEGLALFNPEAVASHQEEETALETIEDFIVNHFEEE